MIADVVITENRKGRTMPVARRIRTFMPYVLLGAMVAVFLVVPQAAGQNVGPFNFYNALQNWSSVGLLALGVGLTMIAREFDLGALGTYTISGIIAVKVGEHDPLLGIAAAVAVGVLVGVLQGYLVGRWGLSSMPVGLGVYIALLGATMAISGNTSVSFSDFEVGRVLNTQILGVFSLRSLVAIALVVAAIVVLRFTPVGRGLRAVGSDRRAARIVGARVDGLLMGTFAVSGLCAAIGGSLLAYSLATALPNPGTGPLVFAITAVLLGGVSLAGGSGTALGIACGALTLSLLSEFFAMLAVPDYVANIVRGGLLVIATVVAAPELIARWQSLRAPRAETTRSARDRNNAYTKE